MTVPNVLTIAGSDPSGGAGIQGDLKTFAAHRVNGLAVVTALTAQNGAGVRDVLVVDPDFVALQLQVLLDDIDIHAIKIGMLGNAGVARAVSAMLARFPHIPVVLDPVLRASAGGALLDDDGLHVLRDELMPRTTLVTPNLAEAGALLGIGAPQRLADATAAAEAIVRAGARAAVVTGGHLDDANTCADVLYDGVASHAFRTARVAGGGAHGTGCAYSSSVAASLALGVDLATACERAQRFVADAVRASGELRVGRGARSVHALGALWVSPDQITA